MARWPGRVRLSPPRRKGRRSAGPTLEIVPVHGLPFFGTPVPAGFPSPAGDYEEDRLDLNRHLIHNPPATYFVRASGESMLGAGIHPGDLLIVDRSLEPRDGVVVIAAIDGQMTVKRLRLRGRTIRLEPENDRYSPCQIDGDADLVVWGVVTHVIHAL
jgi:DNA polymerase V